MNQRWLSPSFTILCLTLACGCGSPEYKTIPTHPVSGRITVNGIPAAGAVVRLYPESPRPGAKYPLLPSGRADSEGVFRLTTYEGEDGAPEGDYVVTLEWPDPDWRPPGGGMPPPPPDRLLGRFSDPKRSTIRATVAEGDNQLPPIILENVKILEGSSLK